MQRALKRLETRRFDLCIIGGGIYGACLAWDATLRGLSVALVEKADFGHATSANSLKIIHGGLRYLQNGNLRLVRMMSGERSAFARIAPHLVHPLPCLMPTYPQLMRSKNVMRLALTVNDLMGLDRNHLADRQKWLPAGRILSRQECLRILPGLASASVTGAALWHDYQVYNTERLTLAFLLAAAIRGAQIANYVAVSELLQENQRIIGVCAQDRLTGRPLQIRAKYTLNAAGPWLNQVWGLLPDLPCQSPPALSSAVNLVTRQLFADYAVGLPSRYTVRHPDGKSEERTRMLFIAPWRSYSIIGTDHQPFTGNVQDYRVTPAEIQRFLTEINTAYPQANLSMDDIYFVHSGLLPAQATPGPTVKLIREGSIYDHARDGLGGLITVSGVKYTMARHLAERTVNLIDRKLGRPKVPCRTRVTPVWGGEIDSFEDYVANAIQTAPRSITAAQVKHLIRHHGTKHGYLCSMIAQNPPWGIPLSNLTHVTPAEVIHAVRSEMAQTLADVVFRRTELGSAGHPGEETLQSCARIMATAARWDSQRLQQELESVERKFYDWQSEQSQSSSIPLEV